MLAPQRVILAAIAAGLPEGEVARATLPPVVPSLAVLAAVGALSAL